MLVGDLTKTDKGLGVTCRLCGHRAFWKPVEACLTFGEATPVQAITKRLRCRQCGYKRPDQFIIRVADEGAFNSPYLAFAGRTLHARCHMCWFDDFLTVEEALVRYGAEATFQDVREHGRCKGCGYAGELRIGTALEGEAAKVRGRTSA